MATYFFPGSDIFHSTAEAIVNPVNCDGVMGAGLALDFKNKFPTNYDIYRKACSEGRLTPGKLLIVKERAIVFNSTDEYVYIVNFPTKDQVRHPSLLRYIVGGLRELRLQVEALGIRTIAIPMLGCGLGGLKWPDVRPHIVGTFKDYSGDAYIYGPEVE